MSKTNCERCYFDLRFGFSDSKYIEIDVFVKSTRLFFVWLYYTLTYITKYMRKQSGKHLLTK